uniref:UBA domain-containing protein n=1 Tax=Sexangularia sp. CB-2014 TaxID=1486929 RepID=A0A7S1V7P5_9EUKA
MSSPPPPTPSLTHAPVTSFLLTSLSCTSISIHFLRLSPSLSLTTVQSSLAAAATTDSPLILALGGWMARLFLSQMHMSTPMLSLYVLLIIYSGRREERGLSSPSYASLLTSAHLAGIGLSIALAVLTVLPPPPPGPWAILGCIATRFILGPAPTATLTTRFPFTPTNKWLSYLVGAQALAAAGPYAWPHVAAGAAVALAHKYQLLPRHGFLPTSWFPTRPIFSAAQGAQAGPPYDTAARPPAQPQQPPLAQPRSWPRRAPASPAAGGTGSPSPARAPSGSAYLQTLSGPRPPTPEAAAPAAPAAPAVALDPEAVELLLDMGFSRVAVEHALRDAHNNVELATAMLLADTE